MSRAIAEGLPEDVRPFAKPRDTRKLQRGGPPSDRRCPSGASVLSGTGMSAGDDHEGRKGSTSVNRVSALRTQVIDALEGAEQLDDVTGRLRHVAQTPRQSRSSPPALEWNRPGSPEPSDAGAASYWAVDQHVGVGPHRSGQDESSSDLGGPRGADCPSCRSERNVRLG